MQASRIFVVGSGVVGEATGNGFLAAGHEVTFIDTSVPRIDELRGRGTAAVGAATTNDRLAAVMSSEVDGVTQHAPQHAPQQPVPDASQT